MERVSVPSIHLVIIQALDTAVCRPLLGLPHLVTKTAAWAATGGFGYRLPAVEAMAIGAGIEASAKPSMLQRPSPQSSITVLSSDKCFAHVRYCAGSTGVQALKGL